MIIPISNSTAKPIKKCRVCGEKLIHGQDYDKAKIKQGFIHDSCNDKRRRDARIKKDFGISMEDYDKILKEHQGQCDICKTNTPGGRYNVFNLDHDHSTGKIRGLLCQRCNTALGLFKDDIEILGKAVSYLHGHSKATTNSLGRRHS